MPADRIVVDHLVMGGAPCIRGTRIPVATIVGLFADGYSTDDVIADYPQLITDDVRAALDLADDLTNGAIVALTDDRIRIRRLPLR